MIYYLDPEFKSTLPTHSEWFEYFMSLKGDQVYRALENRKTQSFQQAGKTYYIKQHYGVGWREIFKNFLQLKLPVLGARTEYAVLKKLEALGISAPKVVAFGSQGCNPAYQRSFIVTRALEGFQSLETVDMKGLSPSNRRQLIRRMAEISAHIHGAGINHRDFYLCHFWSKGSEISVIDWHRAQYRSQVPERWLIKDLSGLYFSCLPLGLSSKDIFRFLKAYFKKPLREIFKMHKTLLKKIDKKAQKLLGSHA